MNRAIKDIGELIRRRGAAMREVAGPYLDRLVTGETIEAWLEDVRAENPGIAATIYAHVAAHNGYLHEEQRQREVAQSPVRERDWFEEPLNGIETGVPEKAKLFAQFHDRKGFPSVIAALETVQKWMYGEGPPMLVLAGVPGTGKSHLLESAAGYIEARHGGLIFRTEANLIGDAQERFGDKTSERFVRAVCSCYWLILDDLGAAALGEWGKGTMDRIVDARYQLANQGDGRTLLATNLTAKGMPARMASRLLDWRVSQIFTIIANDYRVNRSEGA